MTPRAAALVCVLGCVAALGLGACGDSGEPPPAPPVAAPPPTMTTTPPSATATATATATVPPATTTPGPASHRPIVGIGEQRFAMFGDKRFTDLQVKHVRLVTAYDTTSVRFERDIVENWLAGARRTGAEPFITFGKSRVRPGRLPSVAEFRRSFRSFRRRYPDVRVYAAWNEINHKSQPTHVAPQRAAEYYNVVRAECPDCVLVAGDVLDQPGMVRYVKAYRRHLDGEPSIWGLHNYSDTNRFRDDGLEDLLATVSGEVWLTETGGLVRLGGRFPRNEARAARAVRYAVRQARSHERVKRLYLYNWTGSDPKAGFDSGLIGPDGKARPGYHALRAALAP